jgi:hypothetical protein
MKSSGGVIVEWLLLEVTFMSQGWCAKGIEKEKQRMTRKRCGTFKPLINRSSSTFAEKQVALRNHKILVHGFEITKRVDGVVVGRIVNNGGCITRPIFDGTGLPNEGYDFGEAPAKKFAGPSSKSSQGSMVVSAPVTLVKSWNRKCGFAGK